MKPDLRSLAEDTYPFASFYTIRLPNIPSETILGTMELVVRDIQNGTNPRDDGGWFLYRAAKELLLRGEINVSI